jgi:E3 ubiquitin-protein ligase RNF216
MFLKDEMIQCNESHLFCTTCMTTYASMLLSEQDPHMQCIDGSGCTALIPESEMQRFLPEKVMQMWKVLSQRRDIIQAGLEGLVECLFCNYMVVIDSNEEKLFRCGNERCGVVICRVCKKPVRHFHLCILLSIVSLYPSLGPSTKAL